MWKETARAPLIALSGALSEPLAGLQTLKALARQARTISGTHIPPRVGASFPVEPQTFFFGHFWGINFSLASGAFLDLW